MKEKNQNKAKNRIGMMIVSIVAVIAIVAGVSYAWFTITLQGSKTQVIRTGNLELTLDESASEGIMLDNAMPITDDDGMKTTSYKFTLKNTGTMDSNYELKLTDQTITGTRMPDRVVKYWFTKDGKETGPSLLNTVTDRVFDSGVLKAQESISYELRVWIDFDAGNEIQGTKFNTKITANGSQIVPTDEKCFVTSELEDGTVSIDEYICGPTMGYNTQNTNSTNTIINVTIPQTINDKQVTTIGNSAFSNTSITSVIIPEGVTTIESSAFQNNQLTNITIPSSVTTIESLAFAYNQLRSVTIQEKSDSVDFTSYPSISPFGWASGYSDDNIVWEP